MTNENSDIKRNLKFYSNRKWKTAQIAITTTFGWSVVSVRNLQHSMFCVCKRRPTCYFPRNMTIKQFGKQYFLEINTDCCWKTDTDVSKMRIPWVQSLSTNAKALRARKRRYLHAGHDILKTADGKQLSDEAVYKTTMSKGGCNTILLRAGMAALGSVTIKCKIYGKSKYYVDLFQRLRNKISGNELNMKMVDSYHVQFQTRHCLVNPES